MNELPFIDRHSVEFSVSPEAVWTSILVLIRQKMGASSRFAQTLGCDPGEATLEFSGLVGQTVPGFAIAEVEPGQKLVLRGRHRFSSYELTLRLEGHRLVAETRAEFPGFIGQIYRTAVIRSGGHTLITKSLLREIVRQAR
jgi:hypothetical protein